MKTKSLPYEEAAEQRTITGWCCKTCNLFYGAGEAGERAARYCCAKDMPCECGGRRAKSYTLCDKCRWKNEAERYAKLERRPWDGKQMLYADAWDRYFSDDDDFFDYIGNEYDDDEPDCHADRWIVAARILLCDPVEARTFDLCDYIHDDLPEDGEPPPGWEAVEAAVNKFLESAGPLSWYPGKYAWDGTYKPAETP